MNDMQGSGRIISMRNTFIVVYTVLAGLVFALTCFFFIRSNFSSLLAQSENYTLSAAQQSLRMLENFCSSIERTSYIVYDDPNCAAFYPTQQIPSGEEQEMLGRITELLTRSSYLGEYADLGVVYSNGQTAGIITEGIKEIFASGVFRRSFEQLGDADSAWTVLYHQNISRACYFQRINDNAVFIASFYVSRLGNIFSKLGENDNLTIYVADKDDRIIFASDNAAKSTGDHIEFDLINRFKGIRNVTIGDSTGAATRLTANNGWHMYAVVNPNRSGHFGMDKTESFIIIIGLSLIIVFISVGVFISAFYTLEKRSKLMVEDRIDQNTGALTAFYFEEEVSDQIEIALLGGTWSFTKAVIKDQDDIAERLGKDFIAGGIAQLIKLLRAHFGENSIIGIDDDNEITMFTDFSDYDIFKAHDDLRVKHEECVTLFKKLLVGDNEDYKLNVAVGVCIYPDDGADFDQLDYRAGLALSEALEQEGDSIVFYDGKSRSGVGKP